MERALVTRPGASAAFVRHPGQQSPGHSFTFRYRFEGTDGAIHRICERLEAETADPEEFRDEDESTLPNSGEALRVNEELMAEALATIATAAEPIAATASEPETAPRK